MMTRMKMMTMMRNKWISLICSMLFIAAYIFSAPMAAIAQDAVQEDAAEAAAESYEEGNDIYAQEPLESTSEIETQPMTSVEISETTPDGTEAGIALEPPAVPSVTEQMQPEVPEGAPEVPQAPPEEGQEIGDPNAQVPVQVPEAPPEDIDALSQVPGALEKQTGMVYIEKYIPTNDGYRLEPGVTYIFAKADVVEDVPASATTDENGALSIELDAGIYNITETGLDESVCAGSFLLTVKGEDVHHIRIIGKGVCENHTVQVVNAATGEPVEGAELEFYKGDILVTFNNPLSTDPEASVITDKDGFAHLYDSENVTDYSSAKGTIKYKVVSAPEGLTTDTSFITYEIEESSIETGQQIIPVELGNMRGSIEISVKDIESMAALQGVPYKITAAQAITENNVMLYAEGQTVADDLVSNSEGYIKIDSLPAGTYTVSQRGMYPGYIFDSTPSQVTISQEVRTARTEFALQPTVVTVLVTNLVNREDVYGIQFTYGLKGQDGKRLAETNANGELTITGITSGIWELSQSTTPEGTVIDTNVYTFVVTDDGLVNNKTAEHFDIVLDEEHVEPVIVSKSTLTISIIDAEDGSIVKNAGFEVLNGDGQVVTNGILNGSAAVVTDLPEGTYTVKQTATGTGYIIDTQEYPAEMNINREIQILNQRVRGYIDIYKLSSTRMEGIEGARYQILDENGNELEIISTDEYGRTTTTNYLIGKYSNGEMEKTTYQVREYKTPSEYKEDDKTYTISFDYLGNTVPLVYIRIRIPAFLKNPATRTSTVTVENPAASAAPAQSSGGQTSAQSSGRQSSGSQGSSSVGGSTYRSQETGSNNTGSPTAEEVSSEGSGGKKDPQSVTASQTGITDKRPLLLIAAGCLAACGICFTCAFVLKRKRIRKHKNN